MSRDKMLISEMEKALKDFDAGNIKFVALINRLESCIGHMSDEAPEWRGEIYQQWAILEDTYAYESSCGHEVISEDGMPHIEAALREIRRMISEKTRNPL